ncbi:MAG: hypothetical protein AB1432_01370 [Bacteroidota bacterium]
MTKKRNYEYTNEELADIAIAYPDFKCPQFPLYVNDILGSTRVMMLSDIEFRAYFNLLFTEWGEKDCGLPTTVESLVRLSRAGGNISEENINNIKKFFFEYKGRLFNRRLLEERVKQIKKREINRDNVNKRYEQPTTVESLVDKNRENELPKGSVRRGFSDNDIDNDNDINSLKEGIIREITLEPLDERKSQFGGPTFGAVKEFFIQNNRSVDEAVIFWNEYEQKKWYVSNREGEPTRKMKTTRDWMLKAEQWIKKARILEIDKSKNKSEFQQRIENSTYKPAYQTPKNTKCECGCGKSGTMRIDKYLVASRKCYEKLKADESAGFQILGSVIKSLNNKNEEVQT